MKLELKGKNRKDRKAIIHDAAQAARSDAYANGVDGSKLYFAYGSNLHLEQMARRCPTATPVASALLHGWKLTFRGVADIVEGDAGDIVYGGLFRIEGKDEHALDVYEGYPHLYGKHTIMVDTDEGKVEAMVYTMNDTRDVSRPMDYYFETIKEGFRNWALPMVSLHDAKKIAVGIADFIAGEDRHFDRYVDEERGYMAARAARTADRRAALDDEYAVNTSPEKKMNDFIRYVGNAEDAALMNWARSINEY